MATRRARWRQLGSVAKGVARYRLSSWTAFPRFIEDEFLDYRNFIFRGQCAASWHLEPQLDRVLRKKGLVSSQPARRRHLESFKYASRGRRGVAPHRIEMEDEWWALGQHFGLATPLLDWTSSPYVAAYFAFASIDNGGENRRAIWALDRAMVAHRCDTIRKNAPPAPRPPVIDFVRPMSDDNSRLVSQGGLFTRGPDGVTIDDWVTSNFADEDEVVILAKIELPNSDRHLALRALNRMNINHLSLFPDLYGASKYCNFDLEIPSY